MLLRLLLLALALLLPPLPAQATEREGPLLALQRGTHSVEGQLIAAEDGTGLEGVRVLLSRSTWTGDPLPEPWAPAQPVGEPLGLLRTGPEGVFSITGLEAGSYLLQPRLPEAEPAVFSTGAEDEQQLRVVLPAGRKVEASVVAAGAPLAGATLLVAGFEEGPGEGRRGARLRTAAELRRFTPIVLEQPTQVIRGLPEGRVWLKAWHEEWGYSEARLVELRGEASAVVAVELEVRGPRLGLTLPAAAPTSSLSGIGVTLEPQRGRSPRIQEVMSGGPADRAGIEVGDAVVRLDGLDTRWMRSAELIQRTRGPAGSRLVLTLSRNGAERQLELERVALEPSR